MSEIAAPTIRVAIIGAGPAGFYTAEHLLKSQKVVASVDLYDLLPTPYGLVRLGVAPDHEKIRNVTRKYDAVAAHERFRLSVLSCGRPQKNFRR